MSVIPPWLDPCIFGALLDEMRAHSTEWLDSRHREVVEAQRRLRSEELAIVRVLDERGRVDVSVGRDGESARTLRDKVETARALESLPNIAAVAHDGRLSDEQLSAVTKLADEESDAHWAARAANLTPGDLARLNRRHEKPTVEESQARYAARNVRMWWEADRGMLQVRGELPDVLGAKFEATMKQLTERMRPPKGQPWEPWNRRAADALGLMCDAVAVAETVESPQLSPRPLFAVDVPFDGPAEVVGIPLPDAMLELRGQASIEPVLVDDDGIAIGIGRRSSALSPKKIRAVLLRDGHCRCENCDLRYGLQVHHLRPRTWVAVMTSRTSPPSPASTIRC